jgi:hypothetical protein
MIDFLSGNSRPGNVSVLMRVDCIGFSANVFQLAFYDRSPIDLRRSDKASTAARPLAFLSAKRQYRSIIRSDMPT